MKVIPFSFACNCGKELFWIHPNQRAIFNSAVETSLLELERLGMSRVSRNEKVKAISTLASGQDLLAVLKRYPTFTSCQNAACSNTSFFFLWRVDYALEGFVFWLGKCDFSRLFSLRGHDTLIALSTITKNRFCHLRSPAWLRQTSHSTPRLCTQGPEQMCLSLEHQNPSKTSEKMGYFDCVTVSLHIL